MRALLDTHAFLWWLFNDPRLSLAAHDLIRRPDHEILVSAASVWEIATKYRLGKLPEAEEVASDIPGWIERARFLPLSVTPAHAALAGEWRSDHRDPFDRMLAAQAQIEDIPLISCDPALKNFEIDCHW